MVVLDTSALLFWTLDPGRLTPAAADVLSREESLLVSSISLWEVGVKVGRGKLTLPLPLREYAERLGTVDRVTILPVDLETWLVNLELPWEHRDPADRTIVATSRIRSCPLVTSDAVIRAFYPDVIW